MNLAVNSQQELDLQLLADLQENIFIIKFSLGNLLSHVFPFWDLLESARGCSEQFYPTELRSER